MRLAQHVRKDSEDDPFSDISSGICIFYLCYVKILRTNSVENFKRYLIEFQIGDENEAEDFAKELINFSRYS